MRLLAHTFRQPEIDRRTVLRLGLAGAVAAVAPLIPTVASPSVRADGGVWRTAIRNVHTGEAFSGIYRSGDTYLPEAFAHINHVLRDHRADEAFPMDPRLLDILNVLEQKAGRGGVQVEVLSGYRSPQTNRQLRRTTSGVAQNSYHMYGQAVDVRIPGFSTRRLYDIARGLRAGGVGYYRRTGFVHLDTGPVRSW
jgi:uncharacterized protein YcbK (DUF882 family)